MHVLPWLPNDMHKYICISLKRSLPKHFTISRSESTFLWLVQKKKNTSVSTQEQIKTSTKVLTLVVEIQ